MYIKPHILLIFLILIPLLGISQDNCALVLEGRLLDNENNLPVEFASLSLNNEVKFSDEEGYFVFDNLCESQHQLIVQQIGYQTIKLDIDLASDTLINISLQGLEQNIETIIVDKERGEGSIISESKINQEKISFNAEKKFSQQLESISGVSLLKTGTETAKPVVHGLYGNRLEVLNNGIPQSGQQWGNDHSPEIDPLSAGNIRVIKGAASLEYSGINPGSVILTEPQAIGRNRKMSGKVAYFFESNGLGNGLHFQLKQFHPIIAWKIDGSLQKSGDRSSPDYFLNNTGSESANLSVQLQRQFSEKFSSSLYFSTFNSNTGILRGAHIGNLSDLEEAINRQLPFFTENNFSYAIDAPRQAVNHHFLKWHSNYFFSENQWLQFKVAGQMNVRKEFDVRRNSSNTSPALSLQQYNAFLAVNYHHKFKKNWNLKTGIQFNLTDNSNLPETGILPLIPDYLKLKSAAFVSLAGVFKNLYFDLGFRYDNIVQEVLYISNSLPRAVIRDFSLFHNISAIAGLSYKFSNFFNLKYSASYSFRNPEINEMYSNGLHQGISGIEEGNLNLKTEKGLKNSMIVAVRYKNLFSLDLQGYHHFFNNYIYLQVQQDSRLTIRGAFPVYIYQQDDVQIYGFDAEAKIFPLKGLELNMQFSFLRGSHLRDDRPLVYMPSNNLSSKISYTFQKIFKMGKVRLKNLNFALAGRYVFEQNYLLPEQDFYSPPPGYYLMDFNCSTSLFFKKTELIFSLRLENMLNNSYRDYMNRQRYYADEKGINFIAVIQLKF